MFSEILNKGRLSDIITTLDRDFNTGSIEPDVENKIKLIINELYSKNNEFVTELVLDRTLLRLKKIKNLRNRAQDGHIQLVEFNNWLLNELERNIDKERFTNIDIEQFIDPLLLIINQFEEYVLKLKDRETSIISVRATLWSLAIAVVAILISIASIVLVNVL